MAPGHTVPGATSRLRMHRIGKFSGAEIINGDIFGQILYKQTVVDDKTYQTHTKMGVRTSLFLTSQRMPSRYGCACERIQFNEFICVGNVYLWRLTTSIRFAGVFYLLIKTELYLKIFILKFLQNFYNAFSKNSLLRLFN